MFVTLVIRFVTLLVLQIGDVVLLMLALLVLFSILMGAGTSGRFGGFFICACS